ncbi:hypothetical protein ACKAV7_013436 [Fusarium commune]
MLNIAAAARQLFNAKKSVEEDREKRKIAQYYNQQDLSLECQGYVLVSDDDRSGCPSTVRDPAWLCIRPFGCGPLLSRHHVQLIPVLHHEASITTAFDKPK